MIHEGRPTLVALFFSGYPSMNRLPGWIALSALLHLIVLFGFGTARPNHTEPHPLHVELRYQPPIKEVPRASDAAVSPSHLREETMNSERPLSQGSTRPAPHLPVVPEVPQNVYYTSSEVDVRAEPVNEVYLPYPRDAYMKRVGGSVRLEIFVNENGGLDRVTILRSTPPGVFDFVALRAVNALRFTPAVKNGRYVKNRKVIEIGFDPNERISGSDARSNPLEAGK